MMSRFQLVTGFTKVYLLTLSLSRFWEIPFAYTHEVEPNFDKRSEDIIWLHKNGDEGERSLAGPSCSKHR